MSSPEETTLFKIKYQIKAAQSNIINNRSKDYNVISMCHLGTNPQVIFTSFRWLSFKADNFAIFSILVP